MVTLYSKCFRKVRIYDPETQIVVGYQGQDLETYSVIVSFDEG